MSQTDKWRSWEAKDFIEKLQNKPIYDIDVHDSNLIFVLSKEGSIYLLNPLENEIANGLIFKFVNKYYQAPLLDFFLVSDEEFKFFSNSNTESKLSLAQEQEPIELNLKPRGKMVTVQKHAVLLWDFDSELNIE